MAYNSTKGAVLPRTVAAHAVLHQLQWEARQERIAAQFDDDSTHPPEVDPLASAQARRAQEVVV